MKYDNQYSLFIKHLKNADLGRETVKEIAIYLLFLEFCKAENRYLKYSKLRTLNPEKIAGNLDISLLCEELRDLNMTDDELKEWAIKLSEDVEDKDTINVTCEFYNLVCKLLDIKPSDIVLESGTYDEKFLYQANKYNLNKNSILRLRTMFRTDNDSIANNAEMFYILNDMNYSRLSGDKEINLNVTKYYFNPIFMNSKVSGFKEESHNQWSDIIRVANELQPSQRIVAAINDNMLSRSQDVSYRKALLESNSIEGIISIPVRLYSSNTTASITLIVLSKNNTNIKYFDGRIFDIDDIRSAGLENISNIIYERYMDDDCKQIDYSDVIQKGCNLALSSFNKNELYENISHLNKLTEISEVFKGYKGTAANFKDEVTDSKNSIYYVLTSSDIDNGFINYDSMLRLIDGSKYDKYCLHEGDLVFTTKSTKVKIAVANNVLDKKIIVSGSMMIVRPNNEKINSIYLKMFFESNAGRNLLSSIQKGTVINTMTLEDFKGLQVPCPVMDKQLEKVAMYNELQFLYKQKKKELDELQAKINNVFDTFN